MKKKTISIIVFIILIIAIIVGIVLINGNKQQEDDVKPIIYYSSNDVVQSPLIEDKSFSDNVKISCTENCSSSIKKDGKKFSNEANIELSEEGIYEITITTPSGKTKETKKVTIDRTPPEVEIKENNSGSYTIIFKDVKDVEVATLIKNDPDTGETISETNLKEGQLQKKVEIKEKGYYNLRVEDKLGNFMSKKIRIK
ncbi:MAG: hypothetical protein HFJ33_04725 [Clostridia bacterium]|nr:hypothetical protein [Clostridia bacterium]